MSVESFAHKEPDCEYFCTDCCQLRLSFLIETDKCKNCGSIHIIKAKPGELDKAQLKRQYRFINLLGKTDPFRDTVSKEGLLKKDNDIHSKS